MRNASQRAASSRNCRIARSYVTADQSRASLAIARATRWSATPQERFAAKVRAEGECLVWIGSRSTNHGRKSYGQFVLNGRIVQAHRLAWEWANGPIPDGLTIDHLCRNMSCVRVDHLEVVTMRENIMRSESKSAQNARKTECKYGHPFTPENTHITQLGRRDCKACWKRKGVLYRIGRAERDSHPTSPSTSSDARATR